MAKKSQKKFDIKSGEPAELNPYKDELKMKPVLTPEKGQHVPDSGCMVLPAFPQWGSRQEDVIVTATPHVEFNLGFNEKQHVSGSESRDFEFHAEPVQVLSPLEEAAKEYGWAKDNIPAMLWCILGELVYARKHK